jgi:hypothetical protein
MTTSARILTLATTLLLPLAAVRAAAPADASGHWEGAIQIPSGEVRIEVDLALDATGVLVGTFGNPSDQLRGYPLANVKVDGSSVRLEIRTGSSAPQAFDGSLSADSRSIAGDFLMDVYSLPFTLARTGEARIAPPPRSTGVDAGLAGEWRTTLDVGGKSLPVTLTLASHADGSTIGHWALADGTPTPVKIAQQGNALTLESTVAKATYSGTVSADGGAIAGTFAERTVQAPMTFVRKQ